MAEAIAVVGALANIIQILDSAVKIVSLTHELVSSSEKTSSENRQNESLARTYNHLGRTASASSAADIAKGLRAGPGDALGKEHIRLARAAGGLKDEGGKSDTDDAVFKIGRECELESGKLMELLEKLRLDEEASGIKLAVQATRKVAQSVSKHREIEKRRKRLSELNAQLATAMLQSIYAKQDLYSKPSSDLLRTVESTPGDDSAKAQCFAQRHAALKKRTDLIIKSLRFHEHDSRRNAVEEAYPLTYSWVLHNESSPLRSWLQNNNGLFWISGKAGSGKSTLMKFLCQNQETERLLRSWCDGKELVLANFFFWFAGTTLQKSIPGLLRSLLCQLLSVDPNATQVLFPDRFEGFESNREIVLRDWTYTDLTKGLKTFTRTQNQRTQTKFCFFIDGLDEYNGNHLELVTLLNDLLAGDNVKLCVSSRPWNIFEKAYSRSVPTFSLQDLSRDDIWYYTHGRIHSGLSQSRHIDASVALPDAELLVDDIVNKAEGVFLWVVLVVRSVLRGLAEGDAISMLRYRVEAFPADLEEFFDDMLCRVEPVYKAQTNQALKLACLYAGKEDNISSFLDFWLIGQHPRGLEDPKFVEKYTMKKLSFEAALTMRMQTRSMLSSTCKDLLCLSNSDPRTVSDEKVEFFHRTVHDFLQSEKMQQIMDTNVPAHFKDSRIIHILNHARLAFSFPNASIKASNLIPKIMQMSIAKNHEDLNERFVAAVDHYVLENSLVGYVFNTNGDRLALVRNPALFQTLVAFRSRNIGIYVQNSIAQEGWMISISGCRSIVRAALGEDERNRFGLDLVDIDLLRVLMRANILARGTIADTHPDSAWPVFLRKWSLCETTSIQQSGPSSSRELEKNRHIWELAKTLLSALDSVTSRLCSRSCSDTSHPECVAREFIKARIPQEWLLECRRTQCLVDGELKSNTKRTAEPSHAAMPPVSKRRVDFQDDNDFPTHEISPL